MLLRRRTRRVIDLSLFVVGLNFFIVCANRYIGLQGQGWVLAKDSQASKRKILQGFKSQLFQRYSTSKEVCSNVSYSFIRLKNNPASVSTSPAAYITSAEIYFKGAV